MLRWISVITVCERSKSLSCSTRVTVPGGRVVKLTLATKAYQNGDPLSRNGGSGNPRADEIRVRSLLIGTKLV
jgi:hypothetical protein